ncbi:MAG: IS1182 family transposase [Candidatus Bipolaricaulota bacterium]|nr:IS1182 family transposase [Candidatus Bipolaricaulota bacterium]
MAYNFLPYDEQQLYLLPASIVEWVRDDSLARFVGETVELLEQRGQLEGFYEGYRRDGWGHPAYHPRMLVKVLVYGHCVGVTSSRKLAAGCENDVALRYLTANQQPDFRTISDFRKDHLSALEDLFVEVLGLCIEAGLVKLGRVALDGRKVAGNASLDQNRNEEWLQEEVAKLLAEAERVDAEEDAQYGKERRGDELPQGLRTREERKARLEAAFARIEDKKRQAAEKQQRRIEERRREEAQSGKKKRGRKPKEPETAAMEAKEKTKANVTDPESRILKTRRGWVQGFNGQAAADCESQVIVAQDLTQEENDVRQLGPMLNRCEEQAGRRPDELLADAGYWSEENAKLGSEETELFIATTKDWKQRKAMREAPPPRGRIPNGLSARGRMERKLLTKRGREAYKQRGSTIEAVFGQMVMRGLVRFMLRGSKKVRAEWSLWCTTHNLLKLWRSGWRASQAVVE